MDSQDLSLEAQEGLIDGQVEGGSTVEEPVVDETTGGEEPSEGSQVNPTLSVQKRLKAQKRAHERERRELLSRINELEARMSNQPQERQEMNPYEGANPNIDEQIHKAVSYALRHKEEEERKAREAQMMAHVHRKYQDFEKHLDMMGDKYDDFHDVVMSPDAAFTPAMRDYAARTMSKHGPGSAGEVLYKLAKNPDELKRIANLHPDDQAEELHKLSLALSQGGSEQKASTPKAPLGNIKTNPVSNSHVITDKTPIGELRRRMKSNWK